MGHGAQAELSGEQVIRASPSSPLSVEAPSFGEESIPFAGGRDDWSDGLPRGWSEGADTRGVFSEMFRLARVVYEGTACDLPGIDLKYDTFVPAMWSAVRAGFVQPRLAEYVHQMLRWGSDVGVVPSLLHGTRIYNNYESSTGDFRSRVIKATVERVSAGRTLDLGEWGFGFRELLPNVFTEGAYVFPLGAVEKPLERNSARPTDDHTRTGLNAASDMTHLGHSLDTYAEIAAALLPGFAMHVSDVEAAFTKLPIAPWLWPRFFHRFYDSMGSNALHLYVHTTGDFGTRGMPGVFKIFFVDVVCNMARAAMVLTLPCPVYVDDCSTIAARAMAASAEMYAFQEWARTVCGVTFKVLKDRLASQVQLMLGFWWDSFERTRTLEERKLNQYLEMLWDFSKRSSLSLRERQQVAGRMQRAVMTMPPGAACLLANTFALMTKLTLGWQQRRTTRAERSDYRFFYDILSLNLGKGYFDTSHFQEGPTVMSDASKQKGYAGGGWCSACGMYDYYKYGVNAARRPIDFLEGDTVVDCVGRMASRWAHKWIPFGVDNQAFQKSAVKGWSRAERLTLLLKRLFVLQVRFDCVLRFFWVSTTDNYLADHLSRENRVPDFLREVMDSDFLMEGAVLTPQPDSGRVRTLDMTAPFSEADMEAMRGVGRGHVDMFWLSQAVVAAVAIQAAVRGWLRRRRMGRASAGLTTLAVAPMSSPPPSLPPSPPASVTTARLSDRGDPFFFDLENSSQSSEVEVFEFCEFCEHEMTECQCPSPVWLDEGMDETPCEFCFDQVCTCHSPTLAAFSAAALPPPVAEGNGQMEGDRSSSEESDIPLPPPRRRPPGVAAPWWARAVVMVSLASVGQAAPADRYSSQVASVPYPRASMYCGLPDVLAPVLDGIVAQRLAPSSMSTVEGAARKWRLVADYYGWPEIIQTDDEERGGKLATFVLHMLENTDLVADSIGTYVWGLCKHMVLNRQADPSLGVMGWHDFMVGMRVLAHVPHEPRRAIPVQLLTSVARYILLRHSTEFRWVQFMFFALVLFFTFSRSECPCPKSFTGKGRWEDDKHWMVRDIAVKLVDGVWVLAVRFKMIKQDRRIERPEARGDGSDRMAHKKGGADWSYVGDASDSVLSVFTWYRRLMSFYPDGRMDDTAPFFLAADRKRPYTYGCGMTDLKTAIGWVQSDTEFGLHGLRVEGYNRAGKDSLAVAHGGWKGTSASRYDRFSVSRDVAPMASRMVLDGSSPPEAAEGVRLEWDDDDEPDVGRVGAAADASLATFARHGSDLPQVLHPVPPSPPPAVVVTPDPVASRTRRAVARRPSSRE